MRQAHGSHIYGATAYGNFFTRVLASLGLTNMPPRYGTHMAYQLKEIKGLFNEQLLDVGLPKNILV